MIGMNRAAIEGPPEPEERGDREYDCDMCGEPIMHDAMGCPARGEEVGEFVNPDTNEHAYGHAACGLEREWAIA